MRMADKLGIYLISLCLCTIPTVSAEDNGVYSVVQISDAHLCDLQGYDPGFAASRQSLGHGFSPLKDFLETIGRKTDARAVVITGDLADYYEAETIAGPFRASRIEPWLELVRSCPVDLFLTLGNHDITTYWYEERENAVRSFQYRAHQARAAWIRNLPCFHDGTYYAHTIAAGATRYRLLFLDNGYALGGGDLIDPIQLDWLNHELQLAGNEPVVVFMHRYLGVADLNGDGNAFAKKPGLKINKAACSRGLLKAFNDHRNVKALFVGHGHKNVSEWIPFPAGHRILQTETAAFAQSPQNWRLLRFTEDEILVCAPGETSVELRCRIR